LLISGGGGDARANSRSNASTLHANSLSGGAAK
jgi:hypothetical protein